MIRIDADLRPEFPVPVTYLPLMKRVIRTCVNEQYPNHRFELDLILCGDEEIRSINSRFRGIDRPTDVLSFPMMDFDYPDIYVSLGSIVISVETARRQAEEYGHSLKRELCFLCAHAALHLLGYDHETDKERVVMENKQKEILENLGITR